LSEFMVGQKSFARRALIFEDVVWLQFACN
jgi:hypothetical protein